MIDGRRQRPSIRTFAKRMGGAALSILAVLFITVILVVGVLFFMSPGVPKPFLNASGKALAGSISEKIKVKVNGVEQGMFIKGKNVRNPVLLYLHGGMPDYFLTKRYPTGLDDYFTVVWWEQRGSGLSFRADLSPESVNPTQLMSDTVALTNHLRKRFGQEKIFLMGHSGGTFIGIQVAAQAPELYHAYIGVAQISGSSAISGKSRADLEEEVIFVAVTVGDPFEDFDLVIHALDHAGVEFPAAVGKDSINSPDEFFRETFQWLQSA